MDKRLPEAKPRALTALGVATALLTGAGCTRAVKVLDPRSSQVEAARAEARRRIDGAADALERGDPAMRRLARLELDTCEKGERNWKVQDEYRSRCSLQVAVAYSFDRPLAAQARAVHATLGIGGWNGRSETEEIPNVLAEYWDEEHDRSRYGPGLPEVVYQRGESRTVRLSLATAAEADNERGRGNAGFFVSAETVRAHGDPRLEYHRTVSGEPWGAAWLRAREPGKGCLVAVFQEIYARE